jgi:tetratricopeptide (TPR) repeat protein
MKKHGPGQRLLGKSWWGFVVPSLLCCLLIVTAPALAESSQRPGRVQGQVTDAAGNPLAGVQVKATNPAAPVGTIISTSDDGGYFSVIGLITGRWSFSFQKEGYVTYELDGNVSTLDRNPNMDVTLEKAASTGELPAGGVANIDIDLFNQGVQLAEEGDYVSAVARWEEFLDANPDVFQVYLNIGDAYREMGDTEEAIASYEKVLEQDASHIGALSNIGETHLQGGNPDAALPYFERAIQTGPEQPEIYFNVAEVYFSARLLEQAVGYYQRALEINPEFHRAQRQVGFAYVNIGDIEKALAAFERFLEIAPEDEPNVPIIKDIVAALKGSFWAIP